MLSTGRENQCLSLHITFPTQGAGIEPEGSVRKDKTSVMCLLKVTVGDWKQCYQRINAGPHRSWALGAERRILYYIPTRLIGDHLRPIYPRTNASLLQRWSCLRSSVVWHCCRFGRLLERFPGPTTDTS
jgi:hypothetical protein